MDERIKEKLINRAKTNPYVNFLGIDFTVIEEGRVEAHMPLHDEQRQYSGVTHGGVLAALADTIAGFAAYTMTPLFFFIYLCFVVRRKTYYMLSNPKCQHLFSFFFDFF